ncbi:MAG TPA: PAS domain S-box protein [Methanoregula sp.]|nr:PAS domain S-box protein [Methanoregula sp.]
MATRTKKSEKKESSGAGRGDLRREAEEKLAQAAAGVPAPPEIPPEKLVHELQVHQVELEMQNEALREARLALEISRDKYLDLYEFAPVGYLTLTKHAVIDEGNLTGAALFGIERHELIGDRFRRLVAPEDLEQWDRHFATALHSAEKLTGELRLMKGDGSRFHARVESLRVEREKKDPVVRMAISDISVRKRAEERLKIFRSFTENARDIVLFIRKNDGKIIEANRKATEVYGFSASELLGMTVFELRAYDPRSLVRKQMDMADASGILFETVHRKKDGGELPVEINSFSMVLDGEPVLFSIVRDITGRKRAEAFRQLSADVLKILNEPAGLEGAARRVLDAIKQATGADAVGMRLKSGNDFPYFAQDGFSGDFLLKENTLLGDGREPGPCTGTGGIPSLECTCGLVISGKTDPANPLFTEGGSFWTNNSFPLLEPAGPADPRLHPRNTCIRAGYGSIAIIPIRKSPQEIIGTLQVNAFRKDCFTPDIIQSLELIGGQIGEALMRKKAEDALRVSEQRLRFALDSGRSGVWEWDLRTGENFWSDEIWELLGLAPRSGLPSYDLWRKTIHPGDRERIEEAVNEAARTGTSLNTEWRVNTGDGTERWLMSRGRPVFDPDGTVSRFVGIVIDITERKRAEHEINRLSEERKVLIDNVPAMLWYKDTKNTVIRINPAAARVFGAPVEEIEGKSAYELFPEDADKYYEDDFEVISSGRPKLGIIERLRTAGGDMLWVRADKIPLKDEKGAVTGLLVFIVDITEIKHAEEELIRGRDYIQAVNEELTAAGEELRLNEARLTASLEEKETLLAEVHHRVKNNLAAFISILSLDGTFDESESWQRTKMDLQNRARSMALIHETLYRTRKFSTVDMGVYLSTLTDQVAGTYQTGRSVRTIVDASGVSLDLARATPCGLIVNELVTNTFKYAFPRSFDCISVRREPCTLRVSLHLAEGIYTLRIADNGVGLPESFDIATARSLGLKLVNFLARHQLRAKVGVSRENGTEFSILFTEKITR